MAKVEGDGGERRSDAAVEYFIVHQSRACRYNDPYESIDVRGFVPVAPDLVVEVVSAIDSSTDVEEKADSWIHFGLRLVPVVDPTNRSVRVYREQASLSVFFSSDEVDASDVVDGWK